MLEVKPQPADGVAIAEAAVRTGVSVHTLRYYERAGLVVSPVDRTSGGRRRYRELDLKWIIICTKLRATGMPIRGIRRYAELVAAGDRAGAGQRRRRSPRPRQRRSGTS